MAASGSWKMIPRRLLEACTDLIFSRRSIQNGDGTLHGRAWIYRKPSPGFVAKTWIGTPFATSSSRGICLGPPCGLSLFLVSAPKIRDYPLMLQIWVLHMFSSFKHYISLVLQFQWLVWLQIWDCKDAIGLHDKSP